MLCSRDPKLAWPGTQELPQDGGYIQDLTRSDFECNGQCVIVKPNVFLKGGTIFVRFHELSCLTKHRRVYRRGNTAPEGCTATADRGQVLPQACSQTPLMLEFGAE